MSRTKRSNYHQRRVRCYEFAYVVPWRDLPGIDFPDDADDADD